MSPQQHEVAGPGADMRVARQSAKRPKQGTPPSMAFDPEVEAWQVPDVPDVAQARQQRRERRAARRQAEAEAAPSEPVRQVEMSAVVPILWLVVPLVLAIVWSLIDAQLNP